jgi:adenine phosphoribosyltransferase
VSSDRLAATPSVETRLRSAIRDVPDFPKPGIVFKDITPLLADPALFRAATDTMASAFAGDGITHVVAVESRGFILGGPIAQRLGAGFVPVRKVGKLPFRTERVEYALEYGTDQLEIHADACNRDSRVLVVDDVLATGGTAAAARRLVEQVGGTVVGFAFLIAIGALGGSAALAPVPHRSLIVY